MRTRRAQPGGSPGNLWSPREDDSRTEGDVCGRARALSLCTWARLHRPFALGLAAATVLPVALRRVRRS